MAIDQDEAAMRFDGPLHDRESEPRAAHAARGERLEQPLLNVARDSRTVVGDAQRHGIFDSRGS